MKKNSHRLIKFQVFFLHWVKNLFTDLWWSHIVSLNLVKIGSGKGLLPHGTKPLPEPMLFIISGVLWNSHEGNFTGNVQDTHCWIVFENDKFRISAASPGANELIFSSCQSCALVKSGLSHYTVHPWYLVVTCHCHSHNDMSHGSDDNISMA